jgi:hypothetical protein
VTGAFTMISLLRLLVGKPGCIGFLPVEHDIERTTGRKGKWPAGRDADVVRLTDGVTNTDEVGALLCLVRGVALRHAGHTPAAREALTEAARVRSRDASIRLRAFLERGQCWLADGQRARARQDFERVLAQDASFPGLQDALASVQR